MLHPIVGENFVGVAVELLPIASYKRIVDEIANLNWSCLSRADLMAIAMAYYYFSVQFRENLEIACELRPWDQNLAQLRAGECETDNLSPFAGVAHSGERMNHDEFMRRIVAMSDLGNETKARIADCGTAYLQQVRCMDATARAISISSYEDGGLEAVFRAMLRSPDWNHPALRAFAHFLTGHIAFDSNEDCGHGALARHMVPDDRILPLWVAFRDILVTAAPALLT